MTTLSGWGEFAAAIFFFLLSHSIPVRPPVKSALSQRLGAAGFTLAYSLLSIGALAWLIGAAARAPVVMVWDWSPWQNHVTFTAMALACAVATLAIGRPNPLSFGGAYNERFDPSQPGIVGWFRHPLLVALLLWSLGHLLANGTLSHVILFGLFAVFCLVGMRLIDRRKRRMFGETEWARLAGGPRVIQPTVNGGLRLALGALAYCLLLLGHGPLIGVQPTF